MAKKKRPSPASLVPVLFLNGTGCDERILSAIEPQLPSRQIIHAPMTGAQSAADQARLILEGAPEKFALAGFSLGAIVAFEILAQTPQRVEKLLLINANPRPDRPENASLRRQAVADFAQSGAASFIMPNWPLQVTKENINNQPLLDLVIDMAAKTGQTALAEQAEIAINRKDNRKRLRAFDVPVTILYGAQDQICPDDMRQECRAAFKNATFFEIENAGHFALLEQPQIMATHFINWLEDKPKIEENIMSDVSKNTAKAVETQENVLQVERHDYQDLAPNDRPRSQAMDGFDPIYTDIVDYIVRCTHKIWDERDVGLIYSHYTHNIVLYSSMGTIYNREDVVRDTIQRLASFPERRGLASSVIWNGNDAQGFYTSHLVTGSGRHSQHGHLGAPTGRAFTTRTVADCMIYRNRIYREWVVADSMSLLTQLGVDHQAYAAKVARGHFEKGLTSIDIGENRRLNGQYPPDIEIDLSIANNDIERQTLQWLHRVYNQRMFGTIYDVYAPTAQYHGPLMKELYGAAAVMHQTLGLVASIPDAIYMPQHICSVPSEEGGVKVAVRWVMEGHHLGYGILTELGEPTGKRLQLMGMTHYHYKNGKIVDEWNVYDSLSLLMQIKLAQLADNEGQAPSSPSQVEA